MDRSKILKHLQIDIWFDPLGLTPEEYEVADELASRLNDDAEDNAYDELVNIITGTDK